MAAAAPTGCFKCGRPGHWSRDCQSAPPTSSNPNPNPNPRSNFSSSTTKFSDASQSEKPPPPSKKPPKTRPKLTPDLLLSDDGLGYVLRHFPKSFKYHGRGHEASDLCNLLGLYTQWHSRLLPYYSFDQFVQKVEQVGATRRVRRCLLELRERVARGGDPTKLHEPPAQDCEPEDTGMGDQDQNVDMAEIPFESRGDDQIHEDMFNELFQKATEEETLETPQTESQNQAAATIATAVGETSKLELSEEQKARIEANRKKALERAAARAISSSQAT